MFTLIKREIESVALLLLAALVLTVIAISLLTTFGAFKRPFAPLVSIPDIIINSFWFTMGVLPVYFAAIGALQVYNDRNDKISTFLCTRAATRQQINAARISAGVILILIVLMPLVVTYGIIFTLNPPLSENPAGLIWRIALVAFFANLAGYGIGLWLGASPRKAIPSFGTLFLTLILLSVILIKGPTLPAAGIFLVVAGAALVRVWQKFITTPL